MAELLRVASVRSGYSGRPVLDDVSLQVDRGEWVTVLGSNGAGKTTLLRTISGILSTLDGQITFDGARIDRLASHRVARRGICHVPEGRAIFPTPTVRENLLLGTFAGRTGHLVAQQLDHVLELFPWMRTRLNQAGGTLSGGQQQMLAIGRALMAEPALLMLDEPSLGLAPKIVDEVFETLGRIRASGVTILLVEQNAARALASADRAYVLSRGRVVREGASAELLEEGLHHAYLG